MVLILLFFLMPIYNSRLTWKMGQNMWQILFHYKEVFLAIYTKCLHGPQVVPCVCHILWCFPLRQWLSSLLSREHHDRKWSCAKIKAQDRTGTLPSLTMTLAPELFFFANIVWSNFAGSTKFQGVPVEQSHCSSYNDFRLVTYNTALEVFEMRWRTTAAEKGVILEMPYWIKLQALTKI